MNLNKNQQFKQNSCTIKSHKPTQLLNYQIISNTNVDLTQNKHMIILYFVERSETLKAVY